MTCRCTCKAYGGHCDCWFDGQQKGRAEAVDKLARLVERNQAMVLMLTEARDMLRCTSDVDLADRIDTWMATANQGNDP